MTKLYELANTSTNLLWTALVAAIVSIIVSYLFKRGEIRHQAKVEYEYEQRKKLHELTGSYHGRLINAANSLNYRLWNLYSNHEEPWLAANGDYQNAGYYFTSTAYRLMSFFALIRLVESEAILLDARIATKKDFMFLNYIAAFHWVMTDVTLFKGLQYNNSTQRDHFFSDYFRYYCNLCSNEQQHLTFEVFKDSTCTDKNFHPILRFIDGLSFNEDRLRWDRIVALHLLLMAFLNTFGYKRQRSSLKKFIFVAKQSKNDICLTNLNTWLPRLDLNKDRGARNITKAVKKLQENPKSFIFLRDLRVLRG